MIGFRRDMRRAQVWQADDVPFRIGGVWTDGHGDSWADSLEPIPENPNPIEGDSDYALCYRRGLGEFYAMARRMSANKQ